jgi:hypothetical protein
MPKVSIFGLSGVKKSICLKSDSRPFEGALNAQTHGRSPKKVSSRQRRGSKKPLLPPFPLFSLFDPEIDTQNTMFSGL